MSDPSTSLRAGPRRALVWKGLLEIVLISVGVFLAMAADQWRTDRQHHQQADAALQRFKIEIEANQKAVQAERDYHVRLHDQIKVFLDSKTRDQAHLQMNGIRPVAFEHTAWDLAIATQAMADIDSELGFALARIYGLQQQYTGLSSGMLQAMYLRPPTENREGFLHTLRVYFDDIVGLEPALLNEYSKILPLIDRALKD